MEDWRIIYTPGLPGDLNMAIDQMVANFVAKRKSPPTLRFYNWQPFCLSLGFHQNIAEINQESCAEQGVDAVRRPTGGKAVFHAEELTYSVVAPSTSFVYRQSIQETYFLIAEWLGESLAKIGVKTDIHAEIDAGLKRGFYKNPSCFSSPSDYEITIGNRKLIGSAQRRWPDMVLQHGSILLGARYLAVAELLRQSVEEKVRMVDHLKRKTIFLSALLGEIPEFDYLSRVFAETWVKMLNIKISRNHLLDSEIEHSTKIRNQFSLAGSMR